MSELEEALEYLLENSPFAARRFLDLVVEKAASLKIFSEQGRVVPEIGQKEIREVFIHSYRLLYQVTASEVRILAVLHGARDFESRRLLNPEV